MPSKSKAQQRFFGVVKGIHKGKSGEGKAKKAARDMSASDVDDFASTKHKGLPNRVKKETMVRELIKKLVREVMTEMNEGKLTEAKETIFDVAARVMKDKQNQNYKSKVGMVKVDIQSANLLVKVFKKVNPKMKKILSDLGEKNPAGLMKTLWAVVK